MSSSNAMTQEQSDTILAFLHCFGNDVPSLSPSELPSLHQLIKDPTRLYALLHHLDEAHFDWTDLPHHQESDPQNTSNLTQHTIHNCRMDNNSGLVGGTNSSFDVDDASMYDLALIALRSACCCNVCSKNVSSDINKCCLIFVRRLSLD
jgi:hypothetical protein